MSGLKQHYIPQFLLRGFGRAGSGKNVQVTVLSRTRGTFRAATHGVGAQRAFYSHPAAAARAETLDDRITIHEQQLAAFIDELRGLHPDTMVGATAAAEAVAHLSIRVAHVRDAFTSAMIDLLGGVEEVLLDPQAVAKLLKLGEPAPSRIVRDLLKQAWTEHRPELQRRGFSRDAFDRFMIQQFRAGFGAAMVEVTPLLASLVQSLRSRAGEAVRKAHVEALTKGLAPAPRVESLARLTWKMRAGPEAGYILPDCIAVAMLDDGSCLPVAFADEDRIHAALLPLAHNRLLVGMREGRREPVLETLAPAFAAACWDYFVTHNDGLELAPLIARIGERTRAVLADAAEAGTREFRNYRLPGPAPSPAITGRTGIASPGAAIGERRVECGHAPDVG